MKKFLISLGVVILSAAVGVQSSDLVFGQSESHDSILRALFDEAGVSPNSQGGSEQVTQLSQNQNEAFMNLYLSMYQTVKEAPQEEALFILSEQVDYTPEELAAVVLEGNLAVVTRKINTQDQDRILTEWSNLVSRYQLELDFQKKNQSLAYEALAEDMFYDNELGNSAGIDILYNISLMNYVFFGEFIELPDRSGDGDVELAAIELASLPANFNEEDDGESLELASETDFNSLICLYDPELVEELNEFEEVQNGNVDPSDPRSELPNNRPPEIEIPAPNSPQDIIENDRPVDSIEEFDELIGAFQAAEGDWTRSLPCNEIFCLEVNLVKGSIGFKDPSNSFNENDNNIAAHVTFIQERFEDTLSKSLAPGKVSGNWFEDATCKEAGGKVNLDLNIQAIPVPIKLDPGDGVKTVPEKTTKEFQETLKTQGGLPDKENIGVLKADLECDRLLQFISSANLSKDLDEALVACEEAQVANAQAITELYASFEFNQKASSDSILHEQISGQLATTLAFLQAFKSGLENTYLEDNAPLPAILNKDYCK